MLSRIPSFRATALLLLPALAVAVFACGGGGAETEDPTATSAAPTATRTPMPTATPGPTSTPEPTPTPYNGQVASISIPRFSVDSQVESIGFIPGTNQLATPGHHLNTGWYEMYGKPGWGGNTVYSAHYNYLSGGRFVDAPFRRISELEQGDEIFITMDDGTRYRYLVLSVERYDVDTIPMGEIVDAPHRPVTQEWITLITCGGAVAAVDDRGVGAFLQRDVVVAVKVGG